MPSFSRSRPTRTVLSFFLPVVFKGGWFCFFLTGVQTLSKAALELFSLHVPSRSSPLVSPQQRFPLFLPLCHCSKGIPNRLFLPQLGVEFPAFSTPLRSVRGHPFKLFFQCFCVIRSHLPSFRHLSIALVSLRTSLFSPLPQMNALIEGGLPRNLLPFLLLSPSAKVSQSA